MRRGQLPVELRLGPFSLATSLRYVGRGTLAGPAVVRLMRGAYQAADLPVTHGTLIRAARIVAGGDAVLLGPSAAWACGSAMARPGDAVHVAVGTRGGAGQPLLVRHATQPSDDTVDSDWGPVTSPARTALDLARGVGTGGLSVDGRVARVEDLLRAGLPVAAARRHVLSRPGLRGLDIARQVMATARDGVQSPRETALRLLVLRLGFPEPEVQCPVLDGDGRVIARLDLGWARHLVGLEYDGRVHLEAGQHSRDLARHNRIRAAGWMVLQVDARSLARPGAFLQQLRALLPT